MTTSLRHAATAAALVLFADTRDELPANTNARLINWISGHPQVRVQFAPRARALAPFVREGARFGMRQGLLTFVGDRLRSSLDVTSLRAATSGEAAFISPRHHVARRAQDEKLGLRWEPITREQRQSLARGSRSASVEPSEST